MDRTIQKAPYIILVVVFFILVGVLIPKSFKDKVNDEYTKTVKLEAYTELDNPFQRIALMVGKVVVENKTETQGQYVVKAYTIFGIPFAKLTITCLSPQIGDCEGSSNY
jgi:hypothetical protein